MYTIIKSSRMEVFDNRKLQVTPDEVKAMTGCTHVINGWVFDKGLILCGDCIIDGNVLKRSQYHDWCLGADRGGPPVMTLEDTTWKTSAVPLLKGGNKLERKLTPDVARPAARTAVGWLADGRVLLWCDKAILTREQLQDKLLALGCVDGLMFDGGGSTQGIFPGGKVTSSRKVATLLCFWEALEPQEVKGEKPMVTINAYSKKKDGGKKLSSNFRVQEFACGDGTDTVFVAPRLVMVLQSIRSHFGKAVNIHSGYRTPPYNEKVGGVEDSQHTYGTAADISIKGVSVADVAAYARSIMPDWGGVGIYKSQGFVHVDVRETRADWNG